MRLSQRITTMPNPSIMMNPTLNIKTKTSPNLTAMIKRVLALILIATLTHDPGHALASVNNPSRAPHRRRRLSLPKSTGMASPNTTSRTTEASGTFSAAIRTACTSAKNR